MRRFDKKQNILEANLRLEESLLSDEELMDKYVEEAKQEFLNGHKLNEGIVAGTISSALAAGKLLDLLGSGIKKLMGFLVRKGWLSKDGKTFKKSETVSNWLKEKGEWWTNKVMSFFNWVAGIIIKIVKGNVKQNPNIDENKIDETKENLGLLLFYLTITGFGLYAIMNLSHVGVALKVIEGIAVSVKAYELGAVVVGYIMYMVVDELRKYSIKKVIHTLEDCVEDVTHSVIKFEDNTECTLEKIDEH